MLISLHSFDSRTGELNIAQKIRVKLIFFFMVDEEVGCGEESMVNISSLTHPPRLTGTHLHFADCRATLTWLIRTPAAPLDGPEATSKNHFDHRLSINFSWTMVRGKSPFFFVNYYNLESSNCCESSALLFRWNARLKFGLICMRIRRVCEYLKYIAVNSMLTLTCKITAKTPETCSLVHPGKRVTFTRVEIHPPSC